MLLRADTILQGTTDAFFAVDQHWQVVFVNEPARLLYRGLFGTELLEAEGRRLDELLPHAIFIALKRDGQRALRNRSMLMRERAVRARGGEVWLDLHIFPSDDGLSIFCRDVTELKHLRDVARLAAREKAARAEAEEARQDAEQERREKEQLLGRLETLLSSAPVGLAFLDRDLRYLHVNEGLARINGLPVEAHLGRTLGEVRPDLIETVGPVIRRVLETGEAVSGIEAEARRLAPPHEMGNWLLSFFPKRGRDGNITGVGASVVDVGPIKAAEAALRERDQRLDAFFQQNTVGMVLADMEGRFVRVNERFCALVGRPMTQVLGLHFSDVTHPEDVQPNRDLFREGTANASSYAMEKRYLRPDGTVVWGSLTATPIAAADGRPLFMAGTVEEITERKQREEELRILMANARCILWSATVYETGHPIYFGWDQHFPAQETAQRFIPLPLLEGELYKDAWYRCRNVEDRDRCDALAAVAIRTGESYSQEFRVECADGTTRWVREDVRVETLISRERWRVIGVATDVTAQAQAREALRESRDREQRSRQRLAALHHVGLQLQYAATLDELCRQGVELGRSRLGFERLGLWLAGDDPRELHGTWGTDEQGNTRDERGLVNYVRDGAKLLPVLRDHSTVAFWQDVLLYEPGGSAVYGTIYAAALWNGERVLGVLSADNYLTGGAVSDEQRELLGVYAATLGHLCTLKCTEAELRRRADELAEADRRKDEFLAMLAHELRNPLMAAVNGLEIMRARPDRERGERARQVLERQVRHLSRLVDDLLDVSRITRGKVSLRVEEIQFSEVVRRVTDAVSSLMRASSHQFSVQLPVETVWLEADPTRLEQVLMNLLTNAAKYTPPGGEIALKAAVQSSPYGLLTLHVTVRDNGMGIAPELLPNIFEPFTQAAQSIDRSRGGLGIGLTLVQSLVRMHGGSIQAYSAGSGLGSEFTVTLPILGLGSKVPGLGSKVQGLGPAETGSVPLDLAPGTLDQRLRVLVVEDNPDAAETLRDLLDMWGYETLVLGRGDTALEQAGSYQPDVALLDIGLPGMDGYELARRLRQETGLHSTLLAAVTGYGQADDRRRAEEAGFDVHLTKPVDPDELRKLLENAPRQAR